MHANPYSGETSEGYSTPEQIERRELLTLSSTRSIFDLMTLSASCNPRIYLSLLFLFLISNEAAAQPGTRDTSIRNEMGREVKIINFESGERSVTRTREGQRDGTQEWYSTNGKLQRKEEWKNGFKDGKFLWYEGNGKLSRREQYQYVPDSGKSFLSGKSEEYSNGTLIKSTQYSFGLADGLTEEYSQNGQLLLRTGYTRGLKSGLEERYSNTGRLLYKGHNKVIEKNGKEVSVRDGAWMTFGENGSVLSDMHYCGGLKDGRCREFYPDGKLRSDITYKADKVHGRMIRYFPNGKMELSATIYSDTIVSGKLIPQAYDGERLEYAMNGALTLKEYYCLGQKTGTFERYYDTGILRERINYRDNLKEGYEEYFDEEGRLIAQSSYEIRNLGDSLVSLKTGKQRNWKDGILTGETDFVNNLENGIRRNWYPNGKLFSEYRVEEGVFAGPFAEYYPNGKFKKQGGYIRLAGTNGTRKYVRSGWQLAFDEEGNLTSKIWPDTLDNNVITITYSRNKILSYELSRLFSLSAHPEEGGLQSLIIRNHHSRDLCGVWYYRNGVIRKFTFADPLTRSITTLQYDEKGQFVSQMSALHEQVDSLRSSETTLKKIYPTIPLKWAHPQLLNDSLRNGTYVLQYGNGKTMARISFSNDVPDGEWIVFDPITGDTAVYRQFRNGEEHGYYLDKWAGTTVQRRGEHPQGDKTGWEELYSERGIPQHKIAYRKYKGQTISRLDYYDNGKLKSAINHESGESSSYTINGRIHTSTALLPDSMRCYKEYFYDTGQLKYLRYYRSNKQDSVAYAWHDNGKLQSENWYRDGIREGKFVAYDKKGDTLSSGNFINDKMEGWFLDRNEGKTQFFYYENNKRVVLAGDYPCACVDTSYSASRTKFAQSVSSLLEYEKLQNHLAPWLQVVDSFNYASVFFTELQTDNSNGSGYCSMNLMLPKELAFTVPADGQIKVILNPCRTKGYISRLQTEIHYTDVPGRTHVNFEPQRVAFELVSGPAHSLSAKHDRPSLFAKTRTLSYSYNGKIEITEPRDRMHCMTPVGIRKTIRMENMTAEPVVFTRVESDLADLLATNETVRSAEVSDFFGFGIRQGQVIISLNVNDEKHELKGVIKAALLGGKFAAGCFEIPFTSSWDGRYHYHSDRNLTITAAAIEKALMSDGLRRVQVKADEKNKVILIYWFAE